RLEQRLALELRSEVGLVTSVTSDIVLAGGKRLRPAIVLLSSGAWDRGVEGDVLLAGAAEFFHTATLLHDDLVDDGAVRRGREAAYKRFGVGVSVLSGDFLLARTLAMLAALERPDLVKLFAQVATRVCEGEVLEFELSTDQAWSRASYRRAIEAKTAELIAACARAGVQLQGAGEVVCQQMWDFGYAFGVAFQMADDLLDILGSERELGKPVGGDVREGKMTLPLLVLLERARGSDREMAQAIMQRRAAQGGDVDLLRNLLERYGVEAAVWNEVKAEAGRALEQLAVLPQGPCRAGLEELTQRLAYRRS
ncbi:MAG: polyprenyl synthetase family protein, partial [Deinococcus sp.]|nr:polyprenyl synthetase family protein [Deinococcus sp.]